MLHLMRIVDKATGCVFAPAPDAPQPEGTLEAGDAPPTARPNAYALLSSAAGPVRGPRSDVRDVQERWVDAREDWDAWEKAQWRKEGQMVQEAASKSKIRQRKPEEKT